MKNFNNNAWKCVYHGWFLGIRCMGGRDSIQSVLENWREERTELKVLNLESNTASDKGKAWNCSDFYKACFSRIYTEDNFSQNNAQEKVHMWQSSFQ